MKKQSRRQYSSAFKTKVALEDAIATHGKPDILNSDQGCQYSRAIWTLYLKEQGIQISMDGRGRALDNVWIERFWRSLKYDYVYLDPADDGLELYEGVQNHIGYYNNKIHHTTLETPNDRYEKTLQIAVGFVTQKTPPMVLNMGSIILNLSPIA